MLGGDLEDLRRWGDLRLGWLQDRILPWRPRGRRCLAGVGPGRILAGDPLPVLVHRGAEGLPLYREVAHPGRLAAPWLRGQVRVLAFSAADRGWLCRAQRLDLAVGVAPAEFGVGGDGQAAGSGCRLLPFLPVGHGPGEALFLLLVVVAQGPVAGGQVLVPGGAVMVTGLAGGVSFGVGADSAEGGVEGAEPGQPQLFADVAGCPGGLGGVAVAGEP